MISTARACWYEGHRPYVGTMQEHRVDTCSDFSVQNVSLTHQLTPVLISKISQWSPLKISANVNDAS